MFVFPIFHATRLHTHSTARSMNGKAGLSFCLRSILQMWTDTIRNFVHRKQLCTNVNSGQVVCLIISKKLVSCERNWVVVSGGEQGMRTRVTFVCSTCLEILKFRSWVNTSIEQYKSVGFILFEPFAAFSPFNVFWRYFVSRGQPAELVFYIERILFALASYGS